MPTQNNTLGFVEIAKYLNAVGDGLVFPVILLVIWVVLFVSGLGFGGFGRSGAGKGWTFASFVSMILAIFLTTLDLLAARYMYLLILMTAFGAVWLIIESSKD
jgi:hypothetical protein